MAQVHPHTLEYKVVLLKYLLNTKEWLLDPNPDRFWEFIGDTFKDPKVPKGAPKLSGKELEEFCDGEAAIWSDECSNPRKRRRRGYEAGSEYDELMNKWMKVWHDMAVTHWRGEMEKRSSYRNYDLIPSAYRSEVKEMIEESERKIQAAKTAEAKEAEKAAEKAAAKKTSPRIASQKKDMAKEKDTPKDKPSRTEDPRFEYDGEKLRKVVEAARERACQVGKYDLAAAVQQIYQDALVDMNLRVLLEAILTQRATKEQNDKFQDYVRRAKRKLKDAKQSELKMRATGSLAPGSLATVSSATASHEPTPVTRRSQSAGLKESNTNDRMRTHVEPDSAYASGRSSDKSVDGNEETLVAETQETRKRRRESITSSEAAEAEDLEEAERASKRRRGEDVEEDDSGNYHPKRKRAAHKPRKRQSARENEDDSRESSPLSSAGDTDIEAAKEAYVDEMVRRKSAEASRQAIEDEYGPVSPTVADDASWKSMPSPTLQAAQVERNSAQAQAQVQAGAENNARNKAPAAGPSHVPAPPPTAPPAEVLTQAESSHAFQIISGAAAEAVQPAIDRLESKIDALMNSRGGQATALLQRPPTPASGSKGPELPKAALIDIQELINKGELDSPSPDVTKLISQLARNAAEASIHAAEAARRAGEMARDVSMVLLHLGTKAKEDAGPSTVRTRSRKN